MTMKRLCLTLLLLAWGLCAAAAEKSPTIVYINGAKYYIHTVQAGETLYALSKAYDVSEKVILENNPSLAGGLKAAAVIKIPFVSEVPAPKPDRKLRKTFDFHTVAKGETLYAISRQYEIPIQTIIEDNPTLDPIHLRLGERILIRRKQIGSEDEAGTQQQWEEYRNSLNSVAEAGTSYHIVRPGETFYSLARRYEITEEELGRLNGGLKPADLKAGAMIKVPGEALPAPAAADFADTLSLPADPERFVDERVEEIEFRALRTGQPLNVALLLPMAVNGQANANYLEFYQGFLLGLDSVKARGYSVNLNLYNTARDTARIRAIVEDAAFASCDLIVGPVYEEGLYPVIRFAEQRRIPVVSPLAHITRMNSDVLFQLAPDPAHKYDKVADLLAAYLPVRAPVECAREQPERPDAAARKRRRQRLCRHVGQRGRGGPDSCGPRIGRHEPYEPRPHGAPLRGAGQCPLEPLQQPRPCDVLQGPGHLCLDVPRQA